MDRIALRCPSCGLAKAHRFREDLYFSLFFIPVFPVKKGQSYLECPDCGPISGPVNKQAFRPPGPLRHNSADCPVCGGPVAEEHRLCPSCGQRLV